VSIRLRFPQMNNQLPPKLQCIPVHGVILLFEGHVFKALGNSFVPSGSQHMFFDGIAVI
jgi:hypothetical protein